MESKQCTKCKLTKSTSDFYLKSKESGKFHTWCKLCCNSCESKKNWYSKNSTAVKEKKKEKRKINPKANMIATAKHRAKVKGVPFSITSDDFDIPEYCPVLRIKLETSVGMASDNSPSLDRIIPSLGYVPGNIQVISKLANSMKTNASVEHMLLFAEWVNKTFKEENE